MTHLLDLLLRSRVLSTAQAEQALNNQVLYGDRVGTNLLAAGVVFEAMLAQALGTLHQVPFAAGKQADSHPHFTRGLHRNHAYVLKAVPARIDESTAHVFMTDPHDPQARATLERLLGRRIAPVVVCEARMWRLLHKFYLHRRSQRVVTLDGDAEEQAQRRRIRTRAETRPQSVFTDPRQPQPPPQQPQQPQTPQQPQPPAVDTRHHLDEATQPTWSPSTRAPQHTRTQSQSSSQPSSSQPSTSQPRSRSQPSSPWDVPQTTPGEAPITNVSQLPQTELSSVGQPLEQPVEQPLSAPPPRAELAPVFGLSEAADSLVATTDSYMLIDVVDEDELDDRSSAFPVAAEEAPPLIEGELIAQRDTSPLSFAEARTMLAAVHNRNDIALIVLRACRSVFERVVLLTVEHDDALGWDAVGAGFDLSPETAGSVDVRDVRLSLKGPSIFKLVRDTKAHFLGPLPKEKANILFLKMTGAVIPRSAFVLPVVVRNIVVNLIYCDNGAGKQVSTDVGDMLVVAQHINRSYEALLSRR